MFLLLIDENIYLFIVISVILKTVQNFFNFYPIIMYKLQCLQTESNMLTIIRYLLIKLFIKFNIKELSLFQKKMTDFIVISIYLLLQAESKMVVAI